MNCHIRPFRTSDSEHISQWIAEEGWEGHSPVISALDVVLQHLRQFVAEDSKTGEPVGVVTVVVIGPQLGYVGRYIVRKDYRGKSVGRKVWKAAMEHFAGYNLFIDSAGGMTEKYSLEFPIRSGVQTLRYCGKLRTRPPTVELNFSKVESGSDIDDWTSYHEFISGYRNEGFWKAWHNVDVVASIMIRGTNNEVIGIASTLKLKSAFKIGPLYAENSEVALAIYHHFAQKFPDVIFMLHIPSSNRFMTDFVVKQGMELRLTLDRSYNKRLETTVDFSRTFCVTGQTYLPD